MAESRDQWMQIDGVTPSAAIPGGYLEIQGTGLAGSGWEQPAVSFGESRGRLIYSSPRRLVVGVPEEATGSALTIRVAGTDSPPIPFALGRLLGKDLHPVANPAVDSHGNVMTTQSGPRGKKTPVSIYRIASDGGSVSAFITGIVNPTGLAYRANGMLLVSSRYDGTIYEIAPTGEMEVFAEGMGIATGIALDSDENLYVGDRNGTVFKISPEQKIFVFATLEPSVAAYHIAVGPHDNLFVTAPTTSSFDPVYRIDPEGTVSVWQRGFGRPQGIAFDSENRLYLCASFRGKRGIFCLGGDGGVEPVVAGQGIVGLAFAPDDTMVVATGSSVYRIPRSDWTQ